jgi:hypothetical protein
MNPDQKINGGFRKFFATCPKMLRNLLDTCPILAKNKKASEIKTQRLKTVYSKMEMNLNE